MPTDPDRESASLPVLPVLVNELHEATAKVNAIARLAAMRGAILTMDHVERSDPAFETGYPELLMRVTVHGRGV